MDIKSVENNSLVEKVIELAIKFGANPSEELNQQLEIGKQEILRRLPLTQ